MKKKIMAIMVAMVSIVGIFTYLFTYGDWEQEHSCVGEADVWWYDSENRDVNFDACSCSFYEDGYSKCKIVLENDITEGSYNVFLVTNRMEDISDGYDKVDWKVIYEFPTMEVGTQGCEIILEEEDIKNTNMIVTEYLEYTKGAVSGHIVYGKRRRIHYVIEFFKDLFE